MANQHDGNQGHTISLCRSLSVPIFALLFALFIIYTRPPAGNITATHWVSFPATWGGEFLRYGLRNIAITLGLSCLPGAVIGTGIGWLIARNTTLASGSMFVLRVGQWAPFFLSWALTWALLYAPSQRPDREFYVWTVAIPAVALGSCYQILRMRIFTDMDWHQSISVVAGFAFQRTLYISVVLSLNVWMTYWFVHPGQENVVRHYVAAFILMLFLFVANWTTRSDVYQGAILHRQLIINDLLHRNNRETFLTATLIVVAIGILWELFCALGYLRVSPIAVVGAIPKLFSTPDILIDISASLLEIITGCTVSGLLVLIVFLVISPNERCHRSTLPLFSLTAAIPMLLLPAWFGWVLFQSMHLNYLLWQTVCVAILSFFPLIQTIWTLRTERLATQMILAIEQALPYCLTAVLYGEMMSSWRGLGFASVKATASQQFETGIALLFLTLSLLLGLSVSLRFLVKHFFPPRVIEPMINHLEGLMINTSSVKGEPY